MKSLKRLLLINWLYFSRQLIELENGVSIIGNPLIFPSTTTGKIVVFMAFNLLAAVGETK